MQVLSKTDSNSYVVFQLTGVEYALNSDSILEIKVAQELPISPIHASLPIKGLSYLHESIVPIIDVNLLINQKTTEIDELAVVLVIRTSRTLLGLLIERTPDIKDIEFNSIQPYSDGEHIYHDLISGRAIIADKELFVLNIDNLLKAI